MPSVLQSAPEAPAQSSPTQIIAKYHAKAPVDVIGIARELGLTVWSMDSLPPSISGKIFRDAENGGTSGFSIAVNSREAPVRQRFTIAHEIGHFILHRNKLENGGLTDDTMYRSGLSSKEEAAANNLAAHILMPYSLINSLVASGVRDVETIAAHLQVSTLALKIRLGIPT